MELLINKAKVSEILQVAIGYNEKEFEVFIREAQDFDLKPLLCEDFYYELVENRADSSDWQKAIEGGPYTYESKNYFFRGIGDVLAYFTYARFILKCNYVSTSHGFSIKKTPHSEPMTLQEKRNMYYKYQEDANTIFADFKRYVERNTDLYDSWDSCNECNSPTKTTGFKTSVIK
ncbi:DUF6712 family protein [Aegicerativicinus sediminis]|uniref:DUF6712 family protein n=1 Tax=Aegicerativicinus sediminis TaxID=2893202 RepID=UPI001E44C418|nr:hypothetical protein [Aegicerativicinus sediminis]